MIGEGKFRADLKRGFDLLAKLQLGVYFNPRPTTSRETTEVLRASSGYVEAYKSYLTLQAFDILLDDGSFLFFRRDLQDLTLLSYGYFESPYAAMPFGRFLEEYCGIDSQGRIDAWEEYEDYRAQLPLRAHVTPVRYDWSPSLYREGAHPAAHLHLGYDTEFRLAVDALLTPLQFVLLIIRHFYVAAWETKACGFPDVIHEAASISHSGIVPEYRKGRDLMELRLVAATNNRTVADIEPKSPTQPSRSTKRR